jgi:hypothetical protein
MTIFKRLRAPTSARGPHLFTTIAHHDRLCDGHDEMRLTNQADWGWPRPALWLAARFSHDRDLALGTGAVVLPDAPAMKYPGAPREWIWQWVFPATRTYAANGEIRRRHLHETVIQRAVRRAVRAANISKPVGPGRTATARCTLISPNPPGRENRPWPGSAHP